MADQLNLRSTTFTPGNSFLASYATGLRDSTIYLGRMRATSGDPILEQVDCEVGATWHHYSQGLLRGFRISGTSTADDADRLALSTPYRGLWHYADRTGFPEVDGRSVVGDVCVWDSGSGSRYLAARNSSGWYGLAGFDQYRTAATSGSKTQHSDGSTWRASSWDGAAAKTRDYRARSYIRSAADASDAWEWRLSYLAEGGTERDVARFSNAGELRLQGPGSGQPATLLLDADLDNTHAYSQTGSIGCTSYSPDQAQIVLVHGTAARRLSWQYRNPTDGYEGLNAMALQLSPSTSPTLGTQYLSSPTAAFTGSYYTPSGTIYASFWAQNQLDSATPMGRLRIGSFGAGILDFYSDGGTRLTMDANGASEPGGQFQLLPHAPADGTTTSRSGLAFTSVGFSWDGAASVPRVTGWYTSVDSPASASDEWSWHLIQTDTTSPPSDLLTVRNDGLVTMSDTAPAAVRYGLAAGTHPAVSSGTTKTTPTAVDAWETVTIDNVSYFRPLYLSKTA